MSSECTGPDKVRSAARTGGGRGIGTGPIIEPKRRAWHRPEFPKSWNSDRFETSVVRSFSHVPTGPSVRGLVFAAHARMVSACQICLNCRESARLFKEIFCDDISEFESFKPSQPVSPQLMSGSRRYARHSRGLARRCEVSWVHFSQVGATSDRFFASVSSPQFSISVFGCQRLVRSR